MPRKRITLTVEVELDDVPGVFHEPESAQRVIQDILENSIPHYEPTVTIKD